MYLFKNRLDQYIIERMKIKTLSYIFTIGSLFTGALTPIVLAVAKGFNIVQFFMITYLIGIPLAALLVLAVNKRQTLVSYIKDPKKLALMVLIGFLGYIPLEVGILYAERFVSASLATVIFRTNPLLMLILIPPLLREKLSRSQVVALMLAFAGIYLAATGGQLTNIFASPNFGVIALLVLSAISFALAFLLMKKYMFDVASSIMIFNTSLFLSFAALFLISGASLLPVSGQELQAAFFFASVNNVVGFFMGFSAVRITKTTLLANAYLLSPFVTFTLAYLFLGESIQPYYLLAAGLVVIGILIQRFDKIGGSYNPRRAEKLKNFVIFDVSGAFANTGETSISSAIQDGGRVLALKLGNEHKSALDEFVRQENYQNVFTDAHTGIVNESIFVKEIVGAEKGDFVIMKAGDSDESEQFFEHFSDRINPKSIESV